MLPEIMQTKTNTLMNSVVFMLRSYNSMFVRRICSTQALDMAKMPYI
jgi:hypothetical protein